MEPKYAFLMIKYDTPQIIKELWDNIDDGIIYDTDEHKYGIEKESHITVAPCLDNDVDINKLKEILGDISNYSAYITNISKFINNQDYDVLKCDIACASMLDANANIKGVFPLHTEYSEYHPHMTVAYLKKGSGENLCKRQMNRMIRIEPSCFWLSGYDEEGNHKDYMWR